MRALVIFNPERRPTAIIALPHNTSLLALEHQTQRLDAAGVEYEVVTVSPHTTLDGFVDEQLSDDTGEESDVCDECDEGPDGVPDRRHGVACSLNPANSA